MNEDAKFALLLACIFSVGGTGLIIYAMRERRNPDTGWQLPLVLGLGILVVAGGCVTLVI